MTGGMALPERVLAACRLRGLTLTLAESCTGGMVSAALTGIAGSSDVVERGFVTYSNRAKEEMLGVSGALLQEFGAVSAPVARAMAEGALAHSGAGLAVSVTGIAGPGGGSAEKPVGLVHFATARPAGKTLDTFRIFPGDRTAVRQAATECALTLLLERAEES